MKKWPQWIGTPLAGLVGGLLATWLNWPLPWVVGSLLGVMLVRCMGWLVSDIPNGRRCGQWLVATGLGLHFTREVFDLLRDNAGVLLLCSAASLLLSVMGIVIFRRAGCDRATAFFSSMPGGASEMISLSLRHNAQSPQQVAAAQSLRIVLVVLCVPALFTFGVQTTAASHPLPPVQWAWLALLLPSGWLLGLLLSRLHAPLPWMLGPLFVCASLTLLVPLDTRLPTWLGVFGQWLIGCSIGCHFDRHFFRSAPAFLLRVLLFTLLLMGGAMVIAWLLASGSGLPVVGVMLGMMPGGISEMSLTAEALDQSVALVTAIQIGRFLMVVLLADVLFRFWNGRAARGSHEV